LIIYINPPYAEAPKRDFYKDAKRAVEQSKMNEKYANILGQGNREVFVQFFTRIYHEIPGAILAEFSKVKILQGQHFVQFRTFFLAKLKKMFVCPANTFDNVTGNFPIGFMIWDTNKKEKFEQISADVYDKEGNIIGKKSFYAYDDSQYINDWIKVYRADKEDKSIIGKFPFMGNDFQQQNIIQINDINMVYNKAAGQFLINTNNLTIACVYFAVRKVIPADWLNDRDQFLYPNDGWEKDLEFQNNCLVYTLFSNNIQSKYGANHWIPFTEKEVKTDKKFESHFMPNFIAGEIIIKNGYDLFGEQEIRSSGKLKFSPEAKAVLEAGKKLWKYYLGKPRVNVNASFYDIRLFFFFFSDGRMNNKSNDEEYNELIGNLRDKMKTLAKKIEPKVYEYGFLLK
jgi:hypothetical protein